MIGGDGRPRQKGLTEILQEWIEYRFVRVFCVASMNMS